MITTDIAELQALPEAQSAGLDELNEAGLLICAFTCLFTCGRTCEITDVPALIRLATKSLRTVWTTRLTPSGTLFPYYCHSGPVVRPQPAEAVPVQVGAGRAVPVPQC